MTLVLLAALCLASFRLTSLVTTDLITSRPRTWVLSRPRRGQLPPPVILTAVNVGRRPGPSWLATLVTCDACAGFWVSCGLVGLVWALGLLSWPGVLVWAPAAAGGQLVVSKIVRRLG